jgi:hypothetical protein
VRVSGAEGNAARAESSTASGALGLEGDVRRVAEAAEEVAVGLAPGAALVPADEDGFGLRPLTGEPIEARVVSVDTERDRAGCRPGKYGREQRGNE